jgi:hypothetical protein
VPDRDPSISARRPGGGQFALPRQIARGKLAAMAAAAGQLRAEARAQPGEERSPGEERVRWASSVAAGQEQAEEGDRLCG